MSALDRIDPSLSGVVWARTSKETPVPHSALDADKDVDLVVVGAGYAGLSIALHAAKAGLSVCVLDAGVVGNGASGRNGGFVVPHFPGALRPSQVEQRLGKRKGAALVQLVGDGPGHVFDQIEKYQIRCDADQRGWAQPAHSEKALAKVRAVYEDWKALGADVEWLDQVGIAKVLGAKGYLGGWRRMSGGTINPYALCIGLARAAVSEGARVHERTTVDKVVRENGLAVARCGKFSVRGRKLIIATNGYTGTLWPDLPRSGIAVRLYHCATAPLPEDLQRQIMPEHTCFTDLRKSGGFSRYDADGRIISGGAVFTLANAQRYGLAHANRRMAELFPQLIGRAPKIESYWEGYCSITDGYLPNLQVLDENIYSLAGFSTRGVSLAQNIGRVIGEFLAEKRSIDDVPLDVIQGVRAISYHGFKERIGGLMFPLYQRMDRYGLT